MVKIKLDLGPIAPVDPIFSKEVEQNPLSGAYDGVRSHSVGYVDQETFQKMEQNAARDLEGLFCQKQE